MVVFLDPEAVAHRKRLLLGKDRRPGVALLLRVIPVLVIAGKVNSKLSLLHLGLLEAENVRVLPLYKGIEAFLGDAGPEPVDIPGNQFLFQMITSLRS